MTERLRLAVIGCGHIAAEQVSAWENAGEVVVVDGVEPNPEKFETFAARLRHSEPNRYSDVESLLNANNAGTIDAAYIATPHAFHAQQAIACLNAGLDTLLEKPMALTLDEAETIADAVERSGATFVVAFNGSLSPHIQNTAERVAAGEFGEIKGIAVQVSEDWGRRYRDHWKQDPTVSGGGFLLDTGAHAINAVLHLSGCGVARVSARFESPTEGCEITASLSGVMDNGALLSLMACGDTSPPCTGEVTLYCQNATVSCDPWGRRPTQVRGLEAAKLDGPAETTTPLLISIFKQVRNGELPNPSPAERSVEFARVWQATKLSAQNGGAPIDVQTGEAL